jgi:hypothetical protein
MKLRIDRPYDPVPPPNEAYEIPVGTGAGQISAEHVAVAQRNYDDDHSCINEDEAVDIGDERECHTEQLANELGISRTHLVVYRPQTRTFWAYPLTEEFD